MIGKSIRLERIMDRSTRRTVMVPLVHGVGLGPIEGIEDVMNTVDTISLGGANAVILHKGVVAAGHRRGGRDIGLVVHLTATSGDGGQVLVTDVSEAVQLGADAVSLRVEIGGPDERDMLAILGMVGREAAEWGMPLLTLMHPKASSAKNSQQTLLRAARIGAELGADLILAPYPGSAPAFKQVVDACHVPVIAIGPSAKATPKAMLNMARGAVSAGAAGVSVGRTIFQHKKPGNMIKAISQVVHKNSKVEKALDVLKEKPIESSIFGGTVIW